MRLTYLAATLLLAVTACGGPKSPGSSPANGTTAPGATLGDAVGAADTPASAAIGLAVIVNNRLALPDGASVSLPDGLTIFNGYATPDGWLLRATNSLWLVTPDHATHELIGDASYPVAVGPDGRRFAWTAGGQLILGHLTDGHIVTDTTQPAPARGNPFLYTGSALILGAGCCSGVSEFDVWVPSRGAYVPSWDATTNVRGVYGTRPGTNHLIGLVTGPAGGKDLCLAEFDPMDTLRPVATACGVTGLLTNDGRISPDGHWLALPGVEPSGGNGTDVIDLTTVFRQPRVTISWPVEGPGVWLSADTMLAHDQIGNLLRYQVGSSTPVTMTVPGVTPGITTAVTLLPSLTA